jgi:hypothetical protein
MLTDVEVPDASDGDPACRPPCTSPPMPPSAIGDVEPLTAIRPARTTKLGSLPYPGHTHLWVLFFRYLQATAPAPEWSGSHHPKTGIRRHKCRSEPVYRIEMIAYDGLVGMYGIVNGSGSQPPPKRGGDPLLATGSRQYPQDPLVERWPP